MTAQRIVALRPTATRNVGEIEAHAVRVDNESRPNRTVSDRLPAVRPHCGALAPEVSREHFAELRVAQLQLMCRPRRHPAVADVIARELDMVGDGMLQFAAHPLASSRHTVVERTTDVRASHPCAQLRPRRDERDCCWQRWLRAQLQCGRREVAKAVTAGCEGAVTKHAGKHRKKAGHDGAGRVGRVGKPLRSAYEGCGVGDWRKESS